MKQWYFYDTHENTGSFNMDLDLNLCKEFEKDKIPRLRFYLWKPYALSLGFNQNLDTVLTEKLKQDNIDVVKRPTGGRAVLHSEELTYSFVSDNTNNSLLYSQISQAIVKGFHLYNEKLKLVELEKNQVDFNSFYKSHKSIPCFSSSARYEIKLGEKKIVGSAQRSFANCLLQHGSILCGTFHKKLLEYIKLTKEQKEELKTDLDTKTISLSEILEEEIDLPKLKVCIKNGFENYFSISFNNINL